VGVHYTWLFAFALITWSLAKGFFPQYFPGWMEAAYWVTGAVAAVLLFVSVLVHELAHSLVAKAKGLGVHSITLFVFGGISGLEEEPRKASDEFQVAVVGPLTSLALAGVFYLVQRAVAGPRGPIEATFQYRALINTMLGVFNLLPGFPLDGGRVFRSILWSTTKSLQRATNIAASVG
jgi:Zn-dependent protease